MKFTLLCAMAAALAGTGAQAANLLTNGSFETGDFTGWQTAGGASYVEPSGFAGYSAQDGNYFVALGKGIVISQNFSDVAGQSYRFSFYLAGSGEGARAFKALLDSNTVVRINPLLAQPYTLYSVDFTGTGRDYITFVGGTGIDGAYDALDNASVVAVPEPASWALMLAGVSVLGASLRRRARWAV